MKYIEETSIEARKKEISLKLRRVRNMLEQEGLEALALTKHANFSWITAGGKSIVTLYLECGVTTILITRSKAYAVTNAIEVPRMLEEERVEELGFELVSQPWYAEDTPKIVEGLAGGDITKVATDLPLGGALLLNEKINPLRYALTDNEIGRYQYLGDTLSRELENYIVTVKPGMTEYEITGGLCNALWRHNIDQALMLVCADERGYKYRHGIPTGNVLKEHLMISVNGRYKGLITTVTRMVHFGKPRQQLIDQYDKTCEIECHSIQAIGIGKDDVEGYYACKKAYEDMGHGDMWYLHGQGGSQGYNNRDYNLTESSHRVTVENQCYCFNPVIDGTKTEDAFIITKEGPLFITKPVSFPVLQKTIGGRIFLRPALQFID